MFIGVFCSLILCAFISVSYGLYIEPEAVIAVQSEPEEEEEVFAFLFSASEAVSDPILEYYRNPEYQEWVIDFFADICSNREISQAVLFYSEHYDVSPALAFALSWEESRFNPRAINHSNRDESIDRGLFQLNNRSFPQLEIPVFYDIESNTRYGIGHLRYCLDTGGTEVSALAMYNAGTGRVRATGAPYVTLNYINRILENRQRIESRFHSRLIREEEVRLRLAAEENR
jgi:hypothetical protein